ncbi:EF-hand calcium-binding domain-containing protein 10 [Geospiza fortis]|uniref:EF-hand calcium-binding domain-containing protein 10 n=1 Tax=Geospiza fortis TaxID=48883 RepID=A0A6I9HJQ6_GEOFO|nr:EF-hand calcium-binding domain-containing protein 10 [Geospiza fortis]
MAQAVIQLLLQYIKDSFLTEGLNKLSGAMLDMLLTHKEGLLGALTLVAALAALLAIGFAPRTGVEDREHPGSPSQGGMNQGCAWGRREEKKARPREFLIQVLERVKAGRRAEGEYPFLMDEANVEAMFSLLDVLGQGSIRPAQYREALKTLGLSTEDLELEDDVEITLDEFKEGMKKKMLESWSVY